jgi:hypothetical protein
MKALGGRPKGSGAILACHIQFLDDQRLLYKPIHCKIDTSVERRHNSFFSVDKPATQYLIPTLTSHAIAALRLGYLE